MTQNLWPIKKYFVSMSTIMDLLLYPNKRWKPEIQSLKFSGKFEYNDHYTICKFLDLLTDTIFKVETWFNIYICNTKVFSREEKNFAATIVNVWCHPTNFLTHSVYCQNCHKCSSLYHLSFHNFLIYMDVDHMCMIHIRKTCRNKNMHYTWETMKVHFFSLTRNRC